jgi:hypothetical protein
MKKARNLYARRKKIHPVIRCIALKILAHQKEDPAPKDRSWKVTALSSSGFSLLE